VVYTGKEIIIKLVSVATCFGLLVGCEGDMPKGVGVQMSSGGFADARVPTIPKASFEQLTLMDLSAVKSTAGDGKRKVSISYSPPPLVRFVKLNICSAETGECFEHSEMFNRANLSGLPSGKLQITARACVESKYSKDGKPCGPSQTISFENSEQYSPELEALYSQRNELNKTLDENLEKMHGHLDEFLDEVLQCSKNNQDKMYAEALGGVIMSVMALGEKLVDKGIKEFLKDKPATEKAEADSKETSSVKDEMAKADPKDAEKMEAKSEWWKGKKWDDLVSPPDAAVGSLESYIKSIKVFGYSPVPKDFAFATVWADLLNKGHKPVDAVKFVGGSIVSLLTADKVIVPACTAEQRLKTNNAAASENMKAAAASLRDVEDAIVRLGGSL
jgi:hypothetical protein